MKKSERILFIIPAYNEEANILTTYQSIQTYNKEHKTNYEVIVINDGSSDRTQQICEEHLIPHVNLIHNLGIGGAVQTGYKYALEHDYDIAIQFDGDGQHDINYAKNIIEPLIKKEANLVIGSRFIKDISRFKSTGARRIGIKIISKCIQFLCHKTITDPTSGFRAADRNVIQHFAKFYPSEYPEPVSIVDLLGQDQNILEVPVSMKERRGGVSSIHSWKSVYYMINVIFSMFVAKNRGGK